MKKSLLAGCVIAIALIIAGYSIQTGFRSLKTAGSFVEVRGLAERIELADFGQWTINLRIVGKTLQEITTRKTNDMNTFLAFLKQEGFSDDEIDILPFNLEDLESNAYTSEKFRFRYNGTASIVVTSKDVKKIDAAAKKTSSLYEKGINILGTSTRYEYTALNDIKPAMLKEAAENAYKAALTFTKDSNLKLGRLQEASQGLFSISSTYGDSYNKPSLYKKIRVVTRVKYLIEQ